MSDKPGMVRRYDFDRVVRILFTVAVVVAVLMLVRYLADVLIPLAIAALLAYLLNPLVQWVDKRVRRRALSVIIVLAGLILSLLAVLLITLPIMVRQVSDFSMMIDAMRGDSTTGPAEPTEDGLPAFSFRDRYEAFKQAQSDDLRAWLARGETMLQEVEWGPVLVKLGGKLVPGILGAISGVISLVLGLTGFIVVILYLAFLLVDYPIYANRWREFLPPTYREAIVSFTDEFGLAMSKYFRGQFIISFFTGALFVVGFWLIGLRLALLLGFFIGVLSMVPYLQAAGLVPALFLAVLRAIERQEPGSPPSIWGSVILVLVVFGLVQLVQDLVLTPRIMGRQTGLRPVVMLVGVFIWGKLLGFLGVVLAIPLTCIGLAYYRKFVLERRPG